MPGEFELIQQFFQREQAEQGSRADSRPGDRGRGVVVGGHPERGCMPLPAREGVAEKALGDPIQQVYERMWQPRYPEIEAI